LLNFFTMTEFWDKPAEKSGKVLAAFLEGLPLVITMQQKSKLRKRTLLSKQASYSADDNFKGRHFNSKVFRARSFKQFLCWS
jgi:hypothetical protein